MGLLDVDAWTIIFWRSLFALLFTSSLMAFDADQTIIKPDRAGCIAGVLSATAMLAFILALTMTTVANVAAIYGSLPLVSAFFAWLVIGERASVQTLIACVAAGIGAIVIFYGSASSGSQLGGDSLALLMTMLMALMTIALRRTCTPGLTLVALSNGLAALGGAAFSTSLSVSLEAAVVLACFAFTQMTLGLLLFTLGSRALPPAETSLLTLAEVPLSTFWVWAAFGQTPQVSTLGGAVIILTSVLVYLAVAAQRNRRNPGVSSDAE